MSSEKKVLDTLTIEVNGVPTVFVPQSSVPPTPTPTPRGGEVLVRCRDAGVHIGELKEIMYCAGGANYPVILENARRLWSWEGAFTLNAVAEKGVKRESSRISTPVASITLLDAIELIPIAEGVDLSTTEKE